MQDPAALAKLLEWYVDAGADEAIGEVPVDRFAAPPSLGSMRPSPAAPPVLPSAAGGSLGGSGPKEIAESCGDLASLEAAVRGFEGCALKQTAMSTVFADGNPAAPLVIVG